MPIYRGATPLKAYRGTTPMNIYLGDVPVSIEVWFIEHGAGLLDLAVTGATGLLWVFPDGTTSTAARPRKTVPDGITRCYASNWTAGGMQIGSNWVSQTAYHGNVKDLPRVNDYLNLGNCTQVTGALADLPRVTGTLSLYNCTQVTGALLPAPSLKEIYLHGTGMTPSETDQTLINLAAATTVTSGGTLYIKHNRTSASDAAVASISGKFNIKEV